MSAPSPRARTARLGSAFDLIAAYDAPGGFFFERGGLGVSAGAGSARLVIPAGETQISRAATEVRAALGTVEREDGTIPIATGAFPFDGSSGAATLASPGRCVRRDREGETLEVTFGEPGDAKPDTRPGASAPHAAFTELQLRAIPEPNGYVAAVRRAIEREAEGDLRKVVLARSLVVEADRDLSPGHLLRRLRAVDLDCYAFAVPVEPGRVLVGATPELLVARHGLDVRSNPLAGSAPRSGDPEEDRANAEALRSSAKNQAEHQVVVEAVAEALGPICEELEFDAEPVLLGTANVWHLSTRFRGRLREPAPDALEILARLHPTPAVCGAPRYLAMAEIAELEPFDRGHYAGPVGWVDANGDGEWAIALRCAEISGRTARLFAGAGIVADSDPALELDETERKFRALLDALRWS